MADQKLQEETVKIIVLAKTLLFQIFGVCIPFYMKQKLPQFHFILHCKYLLFLHLKIYSTIYQIPTIHPCNQANHAAICILSVSVYFATDSCPWLCQRGTCLLWPQFLLHRGCVSVLEVVVVIVCVASCTFRPLYLSEAILCSEYDFHRSFIAGN